MDSAKEKDFNFFDTQVKYGNQYTYNVYAYVVVAGLRYQVSDQRITRVIAELDESEKGSKSTLYCLEFYDDVEDTLKELKKKHKIAVVTSKTAERTKLILDKMNVEFDYVVSPKTGLRGKPAPDQIMFCLAMLNVDPQDAVYVGDMQVDYWASERAGIDFIHATYGYGNVKCEHSVDQIKQLISQ